jgi:hypothetical protein
MAAFLRELRSQVSGSEQTKIDDLLAAVVDNVTDAAASTLRKSPDKHDEFESDQGKEEGEANVSAEVGGSADLDLLDEDLMHDEQTRATGFIGKASEIQWLRKLHSRGVSEDHVGPYGPPGQTAEAAAERLTALRHRQEKYPSTLMHTNKASFFLDDEVFEMDLEVDPLELPLFEDAERLMQAYMGSCHNSFPLLAKKAFMHQFYHCKLAYDFLVYYNISLGLHNILAGHDLDYMLIALLQITRHCNVASLTTRRRSGKHS